MKAQPTIVAQFEIPYYRYLSSEGVLEQPLPTFAEDEAYLQRLYRLMLLTRIFDKKAVALQRTGQLGTYPPNIGQEAIGVGIGAGMEKNDIFCPYYREYGTMLWRGVLMEEILLYWGGDERGSHFKNCPRDFAICVPIASQTLHAAGAAFALQYREEKQAVVTVVGDGGTSRGDFYESMNVAGIWNLPLVFVVNNNQWAISVPREKQTKAQTFAQKGIAAGIPGLQVDGNDIFAVTEAVKEATAKARAGNGPTLIEAISYRMGDHTTADDATRYRPEGELAENVPFDPIERLKKYMIGKKCWDDAQEQKLVTTIQAEVEQAVSRFLNTAAPPLEDMFDNLYAELPEIYQAQREALKRGNT